MTTEKAMPEGDWVCPNCGPILNECVTYEETCTHCHYPVFWVEETQKLVDKTAHDALVAALKSCRTSICGYSVRKSEDYPNLVEGLYNEIKRIDSIARAALTLAGETA